MFIKQFPHNAIYIHQNRMQNGKCFQVSLHYRGWSQNVEIPNQTATCSSLAIATCREVFASIDCPQLNIPSHFSLLISTLLFFCFVLFSMQEKIAKVGSISTCQHGHSNKWRLKMVASSMPAYFPPTRLCRFCARKIRMLIDH